MDDYSVCAGCPYRRREFLRYSKITGHAGLPDCNRRNICPRAARRHRLDRCERLAQAEWQVKFELTMQPELRMATPKNIALQSAAWGKLLRTLRRKRGSFHYAWVKEQIAGGNLHMHVLVDCEFEEPELAEVAEKAGFGLIHVECISERRGGSKGVIAYVTESIEYLAGHPDADWPADPHLFRTSLPKLPAKRKGKFAERFGWLRNLDENGDRLLP